MNFVDSFFRIFQSDWLWCVCHLTDSNRLRFITDTCNIDKKHFDSPRHRTRQTTSSVCRRREDNHSVFIIPSENIPEIEPTLYVKNINFVINPFNLLLDVLVFRVTISYLYRLWIYKKRNTELVIFAAKIASYMFLDCAHLSFYSDLRMYYFFVRFRFTNGMVDFLLMQSAQKPRLMFFLFAYLGTHTLDTELCKIIRKKKKKNILKNGQRFG